MKKIILIVICLVLLTGCYDYQELSDMNIVNAIGVELDGDEYVFSLLFINYVKDSNSNTVSTNVITGQDKVLVNAINKAINNTNKEVYLKHANLLVISEDLAKEGIDEVIDYILRDVMNSNNLYVVTTSSPKQLFSMNIENESISNLIVDNLIYSENSNYQNTIDMVTSTIINKRKDIALPYIDISNDNISIEDIVYFKDMTMVGKISNKIYNFLLLDANNINFQSNGNVINIYKKDVSYDVEKDKIVININGYGKIVKVNNSIDLENEDDYLIIEEMIKGEIQKEVDEFIYYTRENGSDLVGFKDKYYKKYIKNVNNIPYEVNVNISIAKNGTIYEAIHD